MITKAWFIVAMMAGEYSDGSKDIYILNEPVKPGYFLSRKDCRNYIKDNPIRILKVLGDYYGNDRNLEKIFCFSEETIKNFKINI